MKVSEKSLELNIGAEVLSLLRGTLRMPKAYLRGLTQREEKQEGVDFFAQLSPSARIFAFQFKAPRGSFEGAPYRFQLVNQQHELLFRLAQTAPGSVFYVLPYFVTTAKLQEYVPTLAQDTWLLRIARMPTATVFGGQKTKIVRCRGAQASINPEYELESLLAVSRDSLVGVPASEFATWYEHYRAVGRETPKRRNPWIARGLRLVVIEPEPGCDEGGS